jgi:hypothetical protein
MSLVILQWYVINNYYHCILECLESRKVFVMTTVILPVDRRMNQLVKSFVPVRINE